MYSFFFSKTFFLNISKNTGIDQWLFNWLNTAEFSRFVCDTTLIPSLFYAYCWIEAATIFVLVLWLLFSEKIARVNIIFAFFFSLDPIFIFYFFLQVQFFSFYFSAIDLPLSFENNILKIPDKLQVNRGYHE